MLSDDHADDGSQYPDGHLSDDGHLEVRTNSDGTRGWHETELGQHDRWLRQAPDLFEKYQAAIEEARDLRSKVTSLTQTLGTRQQERDTAQDEAQENWQSVKRLKAQLEGSERQRAALQAALKKLEAEWRAKAEQQRQFCSQSECLNLIGIMADANEARADELQALVRSEGEKEE